MALEDHPMTLIIKDPGFAEMVRAQRELMDDSRRDEVWDGVYIVSPIADNQHQSIVARLFGAILAVIDLDGGDQAFAGVNVSDREEGWRENYRVPDLAVVLRGNPAKDCGTHWCGGPDVVFEIVSPGDLAREKRPFYAEVGVREFWVLDRSPWALELYRLEGGELRPAGTSTPDGSESLTSAVLPLSFRLVPGPDRPRVEVRCVDGNQTWLA
jgi:Uma2 family endonuclease